MYEVLISLGKDNLWHHILKLLRINGYPIIQMVGLSFLRLEVSFASALKNKINGKNFSC